MISRFPIALAAIVACTAVVVPVSRAAEGKKAPARAPKPAPPPVFDFASVVKKAERLVATTYQEPEGQVPDWLLKISYDQWRDIRFRPDQALWADKKLPFQAQFFHAGLFYNRTVKVNVVADGKVTPVAFSPSQFDYGKNDFASKIPQNLGFAGFRLHYPIKTKDYFDEVIVFLGGTYFRSLGRDEMFGLSARGLAIDTAESWGEEFPHFREVWLVEPAPNASSIVLYALLDSPRVTGAYKFIVTPGERTTTRVDAQLFARKEVAKIGLGAMTSMFFHGENTGRWFDDFRPEVHDSDGLVVHFKSDEWLWRPLDNPKALSISGLAAEDPKGFGLVQRDRDFASYQDLETRAEKRPSGWIEPDGAWGRGKIELVEIPTNDELNDNVVAYWVPERKPKPGEPMTFGYTMTWYGEDATRPPGGRVLTTRRDRGTIDGGQRVVVDFVGKQLAAIPADQVLRAVVTIAGGDAAGEVVDQHVVKNPFTGGWRLTFQVRPKTRDPLELRAYLDQGNTVLTETWSYALHP